MNQFLIIALSFLSVSSMAIPATASITNAKAAELTAHRIDRLVSLSKIDQTFLTHFSTVEISVLTNQAPAYYKAHVTQTQPDQGQPMQLDITYDENGKPLSFLVIAGGAVGPDMGWTGVDSVTLTENALHFVLENSEKDPRVKPFYNNLTSAHLIKGNLNGQTVASVQILSSETTQKLNIYLTLDGVFISAEFIP